MSVLRAPAASILLLAALHGGALAQTAGGTATGDPAGALSNPLWSAPLEELTQVWGPGSPCLVMVRTL